MKQHKETFIKISLEKADEALESAMLNIENNLLTAAQNRIYYSIFYAVSALGYKEEFITSKHGQLLGWFNREFVHNKKIFTIDMLKIYKEAYENRTKSDYEFSWKPKKEELIIDLEEAKKFAAEIKNYIYKTEEQ